MSFTNKKIWKLVGPSLLSIGASSSLTLTSCSVVYPKISWTGEQNININGADEKNEINVKGYFLNDFKKPVISYQDKFNNPLLDRAIEREILKAYIDVEITSDNKSKFTLNFKHIGSSFDIDDWKKVDGCKIVFALFSKNNKYHYEFKKNVVFQSSKILDLSFKLDDSYKPEDYLKQIPSQEDFTNTTIDALEPYRSGRTFDNIKRRDNTDVYFGYRTDTYTSGTDYDEMLLRYVDITNMLKADICYFSQVMKLEVLAWTKAHGLPITLDSFNLNVDELKYDMETATILKLKSSATASLLKGLGSVNLKINIFKPYQLFGAFKANFADQQTYFSQLVPTLETDDTLNDNQGGLYEVGVTIKIFGTTISEYDTYYSYVGGGIFGNLDFGTRLGIYLPSYWLSNCGEIAQLEWDYNTFDTDTNKFKILGNGDDLNNTNFLNIGILKDLSTGNFPDNLCGTSYFLEDESHISNKGDDNVFPVKVEGTDITYQLKWYEIMSFFPGDRNENEFYTKDESGNYQITYFLNNCFIGSSPTKPIPSSAIQFNS